MTYKKKWEAAMARTVAREILDLLRPVCERIEIAGSLRRGKAEVGDIEILYVPRIESRQVDFFSSRRVDLCEEKIAGLLASGYLQKRPSVTGMFAWGAKNKLGVHVRSGIPVDLFATTAANWFVSLVIRTGSKETNLKLTKGAIARGATLNAYGSGVTWSDGTVTDALSEEQVFKMCGVPYVEPALR